MMIFPVIMCGGAGTRLWPTSRPSRPKQFIGLTGEHSLFQETVLRVSPVTIGGGRLVIVAGLGHRDWILDQLAEIGREAAVILEPEARDSAAAMAAAAAWIVTQNPEGIAAVVASDHHIPDAQAFQAAVLHAAQAAQLGRVVTLGVKPTEPSCAFGYIKPAGNGLSAVERFVEKPDAKTAHAYVDAGYLWNSGNFIVSAAVLLEELKQHAPAVEAAAREAIPEPSTASNLVILGQAFLGAPKISIDYALMEKTTVASVLEVDFLWSDLGAWGAIAATGHGNQGFSVLEDCDGCLVRTAPGMVTAVIGVQNLAIIAEPDAVLICDLSRSQDVKRIVARLRNDPERDHHLDFARPHRETLEESSERLAAWMQLNALPIWCSLGIAADGSFEEALSLEGRKTVAARRARVQARQTYVYAKAGTIGWSGPWRRVVAMGVEAFFQRHGRDDGLVRTLMSSEGDVLDDTAVMYDQAFALFALAAAHSSGVEGTFEARAVSLRQTLEQQWLPAGGLREAVGHPYQSNPHMHLLEACLAWEEAGGDDGWRDLADRIVELAKARFIDGDTGGLREFFTEDWSPAPGALGRLIEPGHQFEWAWLLVRHWRARGDQSSLHAARRLYMAGKQGIDHRREVAVDELEDTGEVRSARARLWPQTEWLKAALILAEEAEGEGRAAMLQDAAMALRGLMRYLEPSGLWRDKLAASGEFVDEPAPASSFYHIIAAFDQLCATTARLRLLDIRLH